MATAPLPADLTSALRYGAETQQAIRRSSYLADALKAISTTGGQNIQSGGELASKLLAEALLQYGSKKADAATLGALKADQNQETTNLLAAFNPPTPSVAAPLAPAMTPPTQQPPQAPPLPSAPQPQPMANAGPQITPQTDAIVRTVYGEARGEDPVGQAAVANVILNRARKSGKDPLDVVHEPNQFEPWSNPATRARLEGLSPQDPHYQAILANIAPALQGQDVTNGADHFYSPTAQSAAGRPPPKWDNGSGVDHGRHRFFSLGYGGQGVHQRSVPQPAPQAGVPGGGLVGAPMDTIPGQFQGQLAPGNIDLANRPIAKNPDGSIRTVRSISIGVDGKEVLIPTVVEGRVVSDDEAKANFFKTGQHLGVFADAPSANRYAEQLHQQQAGMYGNTPPFQVAMNGQIQPGMIPPSAPSPSGVGAPPGPSSPPQAAGPGASPQQAPQWPKWRPSQDELGYLQGMLADPRTHDQGVTLARQWQLKATQPAESQIVQMNGVSFYVSKTPGEGGQPVMIPVPQQAMTHQQTAQQAGISAPEGTVFGQDPFNNLKQVSAPPSGQRATSAPGQPYAESFIPGGTNDPNRPQAPAQGFVNTSPSAPGQAAPEQRIIPGSAPWVAGINVEHDNFKEPLTKMSTLQKAIGAVRTGARVNSGEGDIAIINGFQKLVDEGVVKGEDVVTQMNAQGLQGLVAFANGKLMSTGIFNPQIRQRLEKTAEELYGVQRDTYRGQVMGRKAFINDTYGPKAFDYVVPPEVQKAFGWADGGAAPPAPGAPPPPAPGALRAYDGSAGTRDAAIAEARRRGLIK